MEILKSCSKITRNFRFEKILITSKTFQTLNQQDYVVYNFRLKNINISEEMPTFGKLFFLSNHFA